MRVIQVNGGLTQLMDAASNYSDEDPGVTGTTTAAGLKWQGSITASIEASLEKAWEIASDFCGLHKFVPIVEVCERLKGRNRKPGCLRFYTLNSPTGLPGGKRKGWAKDKLLTISPQYHCFTYTLQGSNLNLEECIFTWHLEEDRDQAGSTLVNWFFDLNPVKKSTKEKTLSDMSELGYNFIKGLETAATATAATATAASISIAPNSDS
jgi:hypothetical protein